MNHFLYKYIPLFITVILLSCSEKKPKVNRKVETITVDNKEQAQQFVASDLLNISSIAKRVEYVSLKFDKLSKDTLIGNPDLFLITKDYYVLVDKRVTKSIFCFKKDGTAKFTISKIGAGPGEYLKMEDVYVSDEYIKIYDSQQRKFLLYDYDGKFIRESKTRYSFLKYYEYQGNKIYFTSFLYNKRVIDEDENYRLLVVDKNNKLISKLFPYGKKMRYSQVKSLTENFSSYGDSCTFIHPLNDTIYRMVGSNVIPRYKIKFKNNSLPEDYIDNEDIYNKEKDVVKNNYAHISNGVLENDKYLIFNYAYNKYINTCIYDKINHKSNSYRAISNGFDKFPSSLFLRLEDNVLYTLINPSAMDYQKMFKTSNTSSRFINIYNKNGKEMGNPIIAKYYLK